MFARIIFWKLEVYSCIPVYRNKSWWRNNFKIINDFWGEVLFYRGIGYKSLLKKTVKREKAPKLEDDYMFIPDSDQYNYLKIIINMVINLKLNSLYNLILKWIKLRKL